MLIFGITVALFICVFAVYDIVSLLKQTNQLLKEIADNLKNPDKK